MMDGAPRRGLPRTASRSATPPARTADPYPAGATRPKPETTGRRELPRSGPSISPPASADQAPLSPQGAELKSPEPQTTASQAELATPGKALRGNRTTRIGSTLGGTLIAAAAVVILARFLLQLESVGEFVTDFPGAYALPAGAPVGIPGWLGWQHFFNAFLMILILQSGLRIRREQRPGVWWSSRRSPERKISLATWFHQCLDALWILNGVLFVVLLFATGQWMRVIPTRWEAIPNAISAGLQYAAFEWPTENGWIHYNALQQIAYAATIFIAAPLAIVTGLRMSTVWPSSLSKWFPTAWARVIHFPVMIFFVAFITVHVAMVLVTGAVRNLNHMYASRNDDGLVGVALFAASVGVTVAVCLLAQPVVLAPIARRFGTLSKR